MIASNHDSTIDLLDSAAKVFVTEQYECIIRPKNHHSHHPRLRQTTVEFLTKHFEPEDADPSKVLTENEYYHLRDTNQAFSELEAGIRQLVRHKQLVANCGRVIREAKLKDKLLARLVLQKKTKPESHEAYKAKLKNVLAKKNSDLIVKLIRQIKHIEADIGLEFAESLNQTVGFKHLKMAEVLDNITRIPSVKYPDKDYHSAWCLSGGLMLLFDQKEKNENFRYKSQFFEFVWGKNDQTLEMVPLESSLTIKKIQIIQTVKYYPELNLLVIIWVDPFEDDIAMIDFYELRKSAKKVYLKSTRQIKIKSENVAFSRINGIEHLVYSDNQPQESTGTVLIMVTLSHASKNLPNEFAQRKLPLDMQCNDYFDLQYNYLLIEGFQNDLALVDLGANEVLAYFTGNDQSDHLGYLKAVYSPVENLFSFCTITRMGPW